MCIYIRQNSFIIYFTKSSKCRYAYTLHGQYGSHVAWQIVVPHFFTSKQTKA